MGAEHHGICTILQIAVVRVEEVPGVGAGEEEEVATRTELWNQLAMATDLHSHLQYSHGY